MEPNATLEFDNQSSMSAPAAGTTDTTGGGGTPQKATDVKQIAPSPKGGKLMQLGRHSAALAPPTHSQDLLELGKCAKRSTVGRLLSQTAQPFAALPARAFQLGVAR